MIIQSDLLHSTGLTPYIMIAGLVSSDPSRVPLAEIQSLKPLHVWVGCRDSPLRTSV